MVTSSRLLRLMDAMPRLAAVPSTVAITALSSATSMDTHKALRMEELWSRLLYYLRVKPVNRE